MPTFLFASDLKPQGVPWCAAQSQLDCVREAAARVLGFDPRVRLVSMPGFPGEADASESLTHAFDEVCDAGKAEIFVLPAAVDFSLWQRESLGQVLAEARRRHPAAEIYHDDVDLAHPLLIDTFAAQTASALAAVGTPPQRAGLLLVSSGHGDPASRAQSYRLMRLLWERLGLAQGEVGFVKNAQPFLLHSLSRCVSQDPRPLSWVVLPQAQWETEHVEYARVILENFRCAGPDATEFSFADPPGAHPLLTALFAQRITRLWQEKSQRARLRVPSAKSAQPVATPALAKRGSWCVTHASDHEALAEALRAILPSEPPERFLVKVTWHGYAAGTYTDPAALDLLLGALPAPAIILEGHTSSRNLGGVEFEWETEARENRAWIRQQEAEYLRRTGLTEVMAKHQAEYLNVTEAYWNEECVGAEEIKRVVGEDDVDCPELAGFVPSALMRFRGCPLISFAKFKGPTRLGISNMFGLIPHPLRSAWHGPNITWFARVCCGIARLYGSLFPLFGVIEGLFSAVRWNRRGMYRSRWGHYDLKLNAGYIAASRGLVSADILASRMQGQDVSQSGFFDVVREKLGWDDDAASQPLPEQIQTIFV